MNRIMIGLVEPGMRMPELTYRVTASRLIAGALASRDYSRLHHDKDYVVNVVGQRDIFANTQFQSALFERYLNDWSGPLGRVARMKFRMMSSIFAGDEVSVNGRIDEVFTSGGCGAAVSATIGIAVGERAATSCEVLYALPASIDDNPWRRCGDDWRVPG